MAKHLVGQIGKVDVSTRTVEILASTPAPVDGEALLTWDLSRFTSNPVVLWNHDPSMACNVIGTASQVRVDDDGLKMVVAFDTDEHADLIFSKVARGIIRAVSVGFEPGVEKVLADGTRELTKNVLLEVSFVGIGKDADAGTAALTSPEQVMETEEERVARISKAASALAKAKKAIRADGTVRGDERGLRCDSTRLGKVQRTGAGAARVPARLTRTGVLVYRNPDGSERRELRIPEEVFRPDSLATLRDVPVIDIEHHTDLVTPDTWKDAALGHVSEVRADGSFVASELVIADGPTLDAIESGQRTEISCGYTCRLDWTPGTWNGEPYDCIQRDITYNHVALCPPNRGRAGSEVGLRFDQMPDARWSVSRFDSENSSNEGEPMKIIRLDGKDYTFGSEEHVAKLDAMCAEQASRAAKAEKDRDEAQARLDASEGALAKARAAFDKEKADWEEERKRKRSEDEKMFRSRAKVLRTAYRFLMEEDEEDEDEDRSKRSKMEEKFDAMSDRDVMVEVIKLDAKDFSAEGRSDDYVSARFDAAVENLRRERGVVGAVRVAREQAVNLDSADDKVGDNDPVIKARIEREQKAHNAWKNGGK